MDGRNPPVMECGSTTNLGTTEACGLQGGRFRDFRSEDGINHVPVIRFRPGSTYCFVDGAEFDDIGALFKHEDTTGAGSS